MARSPKKTHALSNDHPHAVNVPTSVMDYIEAHCPMSTHAFRLVYGLLIYGRSCGQSVGATLKELTAFQKDFVTIRCAHLTALVGTAGSKDNRWLRQAVMALAGSRLFEVLELSDSTRLKVRVRREFQLTAPSTESELKKAQFARISPCDFAHKSPYRIQVNLLTRRHANRNFPKFQLPRIAGSSVEEVVGRERANAKKKKQTLELTTLEQDVAKEQKRREFLNISNWKASRAAWLRALTEAAKDYGLPYLVMPVYHPWDDRVVRVDVKMQHVQTLWEPGSLYCGHASVRMAFEITPAGCVSLTRDKWTARSKQTKIA